MKKKIRVLCLFDYACRTGFATVSQNLIHQFQRIYGGSIKFDICAINYFDEPYEESDNVYVFSALKSAPKRDDFGRYGFLKVLANDDYDGIIIIQDLAVIQPIIEVLNKIKNDKKAENKKQFKSIYYFPVDCKPDKHFVQGLEFFDSTITYTEYGRGVIHEVAPHLTGKISVIPHGNNSSDFKVVSSAEREMFRSEYFGISDTDNRYIVSNVNRNQFRKDIPTTILGFIEAKKQWSTEDAPFLYLHMHPKDPMGWDLARIMAQTDLQYGKDYMFLKEDYQSHGVDTRVLNLIYNSSDLYLTTTLGEGWGLTVTEAFATMLPVVAPYNTSLMEITGHGKRARVLERQIPYVLHTDNHIREQSDYVEVAEALVEMAQNKDTLQFNNKVFSAHDYIEAISWEYVASLWEGHVNKFF